MSTLSGRFVWRELVSHNPALHFYQELFGWSARAMEGMNYTLLRNDTLGEDVGGVKAPSMDGIPSFWLDYITVDDVDVAMAQVAALGGTVIVPATAIPGMGRFGIAKDPDGAVFAPYRGDNPGLTDTERRPPLGTFCWSQLMAHNLDRVVPFYAQIFGWTPSLLPNGTVLFSSGETMRATVMAFSNNTSMPSHWVQYVAVDNTDAAYTKAISLGAKSYKEPSDVPGMGRFAALGDPSGATFALWTEAR